MAEKTNQTKKTETKKPAEKETVLANHILDFFHVSKDLLSSDSPEYVNQTSEKWKYREVAMDIANEMGIDWENMTYEQNNALTLNLLIEFWANIEDFRDMKPILKVCFDKK